MKSIQFFPSYVGVMGDFLSGISKCCKKNGIQVPGAETLASTLYQRFDCEGQHLGMDMFWSHVRKYYHDRVVPHKVAVFEAGISLLEKVPINKSEQLEFIDRLMYHDFSKFSNTEHIGYSMYDFSEDADNNEGAKLGFARAWNHHIHHNDHHPEHWWTVKKDGTTTVMEMPRLTILEMVADWKGAGKTYGTPLADWLPENLPRFTFHENTARNLFALLCTAYPDINFRRVETGKINIL